ncbi:hypothetical protein VNI00_012431 [Paramarasmius palmivorus]|uniref:BZIP domain-containing protein n=1 Tax=Paramarasmius palmivorus TaxID=297713 RepID=A0AAW0C465_9AGAR
MPSVQSLPHTPSPRFRALTLDSPLPPSDPPSPTSSDIDDVSAPLTLQSPPRLPPDWRQRSAVNEYRPANNSTKYWDPPPHTNSARSTEHCVSHTEEIHRTLPRRRKPQPILYSFQQPDYRPPPDYGKSLNVLSYSKHLTYRVILADSVHFFTSVASRNTTLTGPNAVHDIPNVKPPCNLRAPQLPLTSSADSLTSATRSNRGMASSIHGACHQRTLTAPRSFTHDEAPPVTAYPEDTVVNSNPPMKVLDRQERGQINARRYYQRHQKERLAKAAEYRKMKREQLAKCSAEDREEILTARRIKQREYTARFRRK